MSEKTTQEQRERVAAAIWQRRIENDDPDMHSVTWEEAITSPNVGIAYEVQEIRRDAETAIAMLAADAVGAVDRDAFDAALEKLIHKARWAQNNQDFQYPGATKEYCEEQVKQAESEVIALLTNQQPATSDGATGGDAG